MSVKITVKDCDCDLEDSKFFGDVLLPEKWLLNDVFSPDELFFCQINLEVLYESVGKTALPERGMLYFFIDYKKKPQAVVRYFDGEVDAYTSFNEDWEGDYDVYTDWNMDFSLADGDNVMLFKDENIADGEIGLLRYIPDTTFMDFMANTETALYFVIEEEDLRKSDFSKVKLKFIKNN